MRLSNASPRLPKLRPRRSLQAPVALQLLDQPPRRPIHDSEVALPQPRIGLVAQATQGAVEAPVGEHQGHRRVRAYVRLGGHPEVLGSVLALRVGYHPWYAPVQHPLAVGLIDREAFALSPSEGFGVPIERPKDELVLGELRDERDVHIEGLPNVAKHVLYALRGPVAHVAPPPSRPCICTLSLTTLNMPPSSPGADF